MIEEKDIREDETKPFVEPTGNVGSETGGRTGWGKRSVTRRFLIAALAITVITNAAVSAGALALISKGGKPAEPEKTVTEDQSGIQPGSPGGNQFGNGYGDSYNNGYGDSYSDPFGSYGDQYGNGNSGSYSDPFGSYGDQYGGSYGDSYNNGYGDSYSDLFGGYGDQYNNGYDDQYNDLFGGYGDQYGDQNSGSGESSSGRQSNTASIGIVISENSGVYVAQVTGSNAKKAGFAEGDKIVSIDGKSIGSSSDLIAEVQSHKAGDTVTVVVERNGQSIEITTVLE